MMMVMPHQHKNGDHLDMNGVLGLKRRQLLMIILLEVSESLHNFVQGVFLSSFLWRVSIIV